VTSDEFTFRCPGLIHSTSLVTGCLLLIAALAFASCTSSRLETYQEPRAAVASWYGSEFHGRPTASGERFDMYGLTCAHRELPFGTVLQVTNVSNNKTVRCVVNDRGPFVSGRDIDLSYAAAREIGLISPGTGNVRIGYLGRDLGYVKEVRYISSSGPYTIQIGSFRELDNALHLKSGLDLKYKGVYIVEAFIHNATYYRIRVGKFQKREEAFSLARTLAEEGYSPLIMHYDEHV